LQINSPASEVAMPTATVKRSVDSKDELDEILLNHSTDLPQNCDIHPSGKLGSAGNLFAGQQEEQDAVDAEAREREAMELALIHASNAIKQQKEDERIAEIADRMEREESQNPLLDLDLDEEAELETEAKYQVDFDASSTSNKLHGNKRLGSHKELDLNDGLHVINSQPKVIGRHRNDRREGEEKEIKGIIDSDTPIIRGSSVLRLSRDEKEEMDDINAILQKNTAKIKVLKADELRPLDQRKLISVESRKEYSKAEVEKPINRDNMNDRSLATVDDKHPSDMSENRQDPTLALLDSFVDMETSHPVSWNLFADMLDRHQVNQKKGTRQEKLTTAISENNEIKKLLMTASGEQGSIEDFAEQDWELDDETLLRLHKKFLQDEMVNA
jgi:hypothetical protein